MAHSVKYNFAFNLTSTLVTLLFPLVTFPYVSRIILPDGIGLVHFLQSIINYLSLFSSIGIPLYAVREIARVRDDMEQRSKVTMEILTLHLILTAISYLVVFILAATVAKIHAHSGLFLLLSLHLVLNAIGVNWFYQATEDFRYIAIRSLIVKVAAAVALFTFVKNVDDVAIYALILVAAEVGSNVFNAVRLRKLIVFPNLHSLDVWIHFKPALRIFVLNLIISIYVNLDTVMLGFISSETSVGYYTAATKLTRALLGIVSSLGAVLLPRFTGFAAAGDLEKFRIYSDKAIDFVIFMSVPMMAGLAITAGPLINVFCGSEFQQSILTLQIISPIMLFIGLSNMLGMQILYSQNQERIVIWATLTGAVANFTLNLILIPKFSQFGAAAASVVAEFLVILIMSLKGHDYIGYNYLKKDNILVAFSTLLFSVVIIIFNRTVDLGHLPMLLADITVGVLVYAVSTLVLRNKTASYIKGTIISILKGTKVS